MAPKYRFTFNKGDGTDTEEVYANTGSSITAPNITSVGDNSVDWTRNGYVFVEWNSLAGGLGIPYLPGDTIYASNANYLYAVWREDVDVTITYKDSTIATMNTSGTKTLETAGTYCEDDIEVVYNKPSASLQSKTVSPSTSQQTVSPDSGYDGLSSVTVNAMPTGTAGTPTATKGTVSNNSVSVTPSVTNTTGYITGGTVAGTAVTVSASELVSGDLSITSAGTTNVTNYATATVASGTEGTPVATKSIISASKNFSPVSSLATMDLWGSDLNTASRMGATLKTLPVGTYTISWKYTLTAIDSGTFQYGSYIRWYDGTNWHILASYSLTTASNPSIGDTFNVARTITIDDDAYGEDINVLAYCGQGGGSSWRASVDEYQIEAGSQQTAFEPYKLSNAISVTPSVTNVSGYINGSAIVGNPVTVFASELVTAYNGAYHMVQTDYTVTISLTNPVNASNFTSVTIWELVSSTRYDQGNNIGSITSATGSTDVTISQSIYGIAIIFNGDCPANPCDVGTVSVSNGLTISYVETGYLEIAVTSNGTVTIDGMDYDD